MEETIGWVFDFIIHVAMSRVFFLVKLLYIFEKVNPKRISMLPNSLSSTRSFHFSILDFSSLWLITHTGSGFVLPFLSCPSDRNDLLAARISLPFLLLALSRPSSPPLSLPYSHRQAKVCVCVPHCCQFQTRLANLKNIARALSLL